MLAKPLHPNKTIHRNVDLEPVETPADKQPNAESAASGLGADPVNERADR
ncbi:hypothetical protein PQU92_08050 [Asticcacaulis sp. BYS171W]|uniref:Uncharacterized protein n=1 Tax=Asticcacaulis aquaticus TaxID=2984212 RepID=A0ABT5HUU7_9CAUL|nr:hypothetical protein [Asticcacaulis aquaticus]MDC7683226.1 hypothetical protein [Asticcacaulis aquaticus]